MRCRFNFMRVLFPTWLFFFHNPPPPPPRLYFLFYRGVSPSLAGDLLIPDFDFRIPVCGAVEDYTVFPVTFYLTGTYDSPALGFSFHHKVVFPVWPCDSAPLVLRERFLLFCFFDPPLTWSAPWVLFPSTPDGGWRGVPRVQPPCSVFPVPLTLNCVLETVPSHSETAFSLLSLYFVS